MPVNANAPAAGFARHIVMLIAGVVLVLFVGFLYVFNRTTFFGEPSVDRTMTVNQPKR
jgi:hypothetical protein